MNIRSIGTTIGKKSTPKRLHQSAIIPANSLCSSSDTLPLPPRKALKRKNAATSHRECIPLPPPCKQAGYSTYSRSNALVCCLLLICCLFLVCCLFHVLAGTPMQPTRGLTNPFTLGANALVCGSLIIGCCCLLLFVIVGVLDPLPPCNLNAATTEKVDGHITRKMLRK